MIQEPIPGIFTVAQLIRELEKMPQDALICIQTQRDSELVEKRLRLSTRDDEHTQHSPYVYWPKLHKMVIIGHRR